MKHQFYLQNSGKVKLKNILKWIKLLTTVQIEFIKTLYGNRNTTVHTDR